MDPAPRRLGSIFHCSRGVHGVPTKPLVVYYSYTGSTATIASQVLGNIGGVERRLVDCESRPGLRSYLSNRMGKLPRLTNPDYDVSSYDPIILLTPIWYGYPTPAMNAFLASTKLRDKKVIVGLVGARENSRVPLSRIWSAAIARDAKYIETTHLRGLPIRKEQPRPTDEQLRAQALKVCEMYRGIIDVSSE